MKKSPVLRLAPVRAHRLLGIVLVLCVLQPLSASAAKFWHASLGPIDIYTSDSPETTKRFVCELLEVRRQIQELVAPVPLPDPRLQVVVFNRIKDYKEFVPANTITERDMVTVAGFSNGDYGLTAAVVRDSGSGYNFGRDAVLNFYAYYLLLSGVPDAPLWIQVGLPEFFSTTECRGNRVMIGGDFMDHLGHLRASSLTPLARLMNDQEMKQYAGAPHHDNVLYHEGWSLWQRWLTSSDPHRRQQIRRLFAAIRDGAGGDFDQVAKSFGESKEAIEAAHRDRKGGKSFPVVVANPDAESLVKGLVFQPATDLDGQFALAMLFGRTGKGQGAFGYELMQQAEAHPDSPRPVEALAALAMGADDGEGADRRWERARELNTDNSYAYLLPVRRTLESRTFYFSLQAQLPDGLVAQLRSWLDRCTQLDPGNADAIYYRVMLEAFASQPDKAVLEAVERSQILTVRPLGWLYLAIARWRLGEASQAHQLIAQLQARPNMTEAARHSVALLDAAMRKQEIARESKGGGE